ncbi:MFS general substrate transporter [Tothia fuscella]|uniref:MFS general substrate transporter n=1 Tax=Tothia fuscella TaxID=1048955 RepID=A0A9P4NIL2_9PEZI|nr:MFS general substrate transporter [Tothia fuscella]
MAIYDSDDQNSLPYPGTSTMEKIPTSPRRSKGKNVAIVSALCLALFLAALDTTLITTALPTISAQFNVTNAGYAWIGSSYLLTNAASVPFWGKISDVFGRKPILLLANGVFLVGSLISALSKNLEMLIAGRAVQGLGGGGIVILVNICVGDLFSLRERGLYFGVVGAVWAMASALGPVLGGTFTEKLGWRWCFWINLPTDGIAAIILFLFLDIHTPTTPFLEGLRAIDWLGSITVAGATVMLLLGLQFGGITHPWGSATVVCLLLFSVITFALFFFTQFKFSPSPIMPFRIFSTISNLSALAVCFCDALVFNSVAYFVPLYFQTVLDTSPLKSGVWMLALAIPLALFSASAGWIMEKTGRYLELLRGGLCLMTLGLGLLIDLPSYISWPRIILYLAIIGIGFGPNFHAPLIALQTHLQPNDVAAGTSTFGFMRMLAGAIGVVLGQVLFQSQMQTHVRSFYSAGVPDPIIQNLARGSAISTSTASLIGLTTEQGSLIRNAKAQSLSKMWILYTLFSALGLLASMGIRKKAMSRDHEEFRTGLDSLNSNKSDSENSTERHKRSEETA